MKMELDFNFAAMNLRGYGMVAILSQQNHENSFIGQDIFYSTVTVELPCPFSDFLFRVHAYE